MNKLGINTFSNIITKIWSMISIYIFIPLYIRILGESSYGLVSFFATLQTTLNLLGLGLSNTLSREFAVGNDSKDNDIRKYKLLRSVELIYIVLGILISIICYKGSNYMSETWLNIEELKPEIVASVISLMGISVALQLIANLYSGCLFGINEHVKANLLCILWSIGKSVGSLLIIMRTPNLVMFYSWHICTDFIYLITLRYNVIKRLDLSKNIKWHLRDLVNIKSIWRYTCGILFISLIALANKQVDKVIISKYLTLSELGAYNVATTLGSLTAIIPSALYTSVFPRFTKLATTRDTEQLINEFVIINKVVNLIISCMGAFIAVYGLELIFIWTGSKEYIEILGIVAMFVVLAVTLIEYQELPYALALSNGNTKFNIIVGVIFIPIVIFSTYIGIKNYGLIGAGVVFMLMMFGQTILYQYLVYKRYVSNKPIYLIFRDTLIPLVISIMIAIFSKIIVNKVVTNIFFQGFIAVFLGGITLLILVYIFARKELISFKKNIK